MAGFNNQTVYANNVDFTGSTSPTPKVLLDGQLLIGSAVAPNIRVGTLTAGTGISITNAAGSITVALTGSGVALEHLTGNSGGVLNPDGSNNINTLGTGSITIAGVGSTLTTQLTGLTNHNVLIGAGTTTITKVAPSATSGVPFISQGASADPTFGTAVVAGGGTGSVSFTSYGPVVAASTTTGALTSVAPSATSGVPFISQGASANPTFGTVAIAGGGTNATSMSTSTGIIKYDGTSLVTSTTAKIDSSNRMTNSSQPCFQVYLNTTVSNVTGDGTVYNLLFDTTAFDQDSNITLNSASKTIFTAPVTGKYLFCGAMNFTWGVPASLYAQVIYTMVQSTGATYHLAEEAYINFNNVGVGIYGSPFNIIVSMTAADTIYLNAVVNFASGKNASFRGGVTPSYNFWCGHLIC